MRIQDNAIIRKDEEVEICNNAAKALKENLEDTQEALSRSRNFVKIIQSSQRRSIKDMAKHLYGMWHAAKLYKPWESLIEEEKEHWM